MSNRYFFTSLQEVPLTVEESYPYSKRNFSDVIDLQWNVTGSKIAFSKLDKSIHILHRSYEQIENTQSITNAHEKPIEKIAFHPIREYIFCTVANDNQFKIWETNYNATSYKLLKTVDLPKDYKNFLCFFSPKGDFLAVIDKANHVVIVDTTNYEPIITYKESSNIYDFTWSNASQYFLLGLDNSLTTLNSFTSKVHLDGTECYEINRIHSINAGLANSIIKQVKFDPRGEFFVTGSQQGVLQVFSTNSLTCIKTILDVDELISSLDISRDGTYAVVCFELSNSAKIYDLSTGEENFEIQNCKGGKKISSMLKFCPTKTNLCYSTYQDGGIVFLSKPQQGKGSGKRNGRI